MVLNVAVQMLREAEEVKQNILKFKSETSMLQERSLWSLQQQLQKIYEKVLVLDLDYALDKKVEQDLWNVGFKQQVEALQAISKDRKNPQRSEGQATLSWVLQAASGFYLCLLHQICTAFKLDLPFRRRASLLGWVEGWSPGNVTGTPRLPPPAAARYICQHCLVHLGDLARYRQQPRVAYTFYRHALVVSTHSGQPYNQLALLSRRRGRRLQALYWHVRAILVRSPFPPAPANLTRTLQALAGHVPRDAPVLRGPRKAVSSLLSAPPPRLDAHSHETELLRVLHAIHSGERLDLAEQLVEILNTSLTSLVATDCFESMTLIKMMCVLIWLVHSTTEELSVCENAFSESECTAAVLSETLAAGALLALLLPSHTAEKPPSRALPALKVCLQWVVLYPQLLDSPAFQARPQIWHALAHTLNKLNDSEDKCETVPLPEDEELHGFSPLERSFQSLTFANHAAWDTYGRRLPDDDRTPARDQTPSVVAPTSFTGDSELEASVRARRLVKLGIQLAELRPGHLSYSTDENGVPTFTALCHGGDQLTRCVALLRQTQAPQSRDYFEDSDDESPLPAPIVISEADFREKVRDKRVGILKPQGSLERAREERALAADDQEGEDNGEGIKLEDRKEQRRPRINIAMAAILRKQEETCKQVKFRTPPPVPEEAEKEGEMSEKSATAAETPPERPKAIQPKPQPKSLSQIPVGRKTGGILSLKDRSGYPHLVNTEPTVRKEEKPPPQKDPKVIQPPSKWHQGESNRAGQRNYGLHNAGISYNPTYPASAQTPKANIRLSVVNPKEIDVRSAALQKQNSRGDSFYRCSGGGLNSDKRNFLDDLPPRFATQRWCQDIEKNKFRDDEFQGPNTNTNMSINMFNTPPPNWHASLPPPPLGAQFPSLQSPLISSSMSLASQIGLSSQLGSPRPQISGQLSNPMSLPPPQIPQYPPPMADPYMSWWSPNSAFSPPTTSTITSQQYFGLQIRPNSSASSYGQIQGRSEVQEPSPFVGQSTVGQIPARHVSPPNYTTAGFGYHTLMEPTYPSFPAQPLDLGRHLGLPPLPAMDPYEASYERRRADCAMERPVEEPLERTSSPLDLPTRTSEPLQEHPAPVEDPGTYSLFSGAPGSGAWSMPQSQSLWGDRHPCSSSAALCPETYRNATAKGNANATAKGNANAMAKGNANAAAKGNPNATAKGNPNAGASACPGAGTRK